MKKIAVYIIVFLLIATSCGYSAKYAGESFSLGVGGRSLAMGGATVAGPFDAFTAYWNPAGMNYLNTRIAGAMHAETFGDLLNHDYLTYIDARNKKNSLIKSFGFYFYYLGGGGIKITSLDLNNRPYVIDEVSHGDYLLAASISGKIKNKIDFGLTAKIIYRDLGTEKGKGLTIDAGLLYKLNPQMNFGLMVTDITSGIIRYSGATFDDGANYEFINPTVKPGMLFKKSFNDFIFRFATSGDLKFENFKTAAQYWVGAISLDTHYGWELSFKEMLFGRAGFDRGKFTTGGGIDVKNIAVDFAYFHHGDLDETFRISASYRW